ncbi:MAG: hypothetical protein PHT25_10890 [Bacteroidales bacterium]|nr:hypothetical protein [Bacteroidales bacterium]
MHSVEYSRKMVRYDMSRTLQKQRKRNFLKKEVSSEICQFAVRGESEEARRNSMCSYTYNHNLFNVCKVNITPIIRKVIPNE